VKYIDEYRDPATGRRLVDMIRRTATRPWHVMEVCGGQTHTLIRSGIDEALAGAVELIHGPGCPVCVTPLEKIDRALAIAGTPGTIFTTFGDMVRVPGSRGDLLRAKARGADVRIVYSPMDALEIAEMNPDRDVVFFAVGFETTAPANAMAVSEAKRRGIRNFFALVSHVRVPPAIRLLLADPDCRVEGFIAPGHVCTVMGWGEYEELAAEFGVPFVVAGFEPLDLLQGMLMLVKQLESGDRDVRNQYTRVVRRHGNEHAQALVDRVFEVSDMNWRGIGGIPRSGLHLAPAFGEHDAEIRFDVGDLHVAESGVCIAGEVLQGKKKPSDCPEFGAACTPESPLGAPMVSSEGACAAYWSFRRTQGAGHAA